MYYIAVLVNLALMGIVPHTGWIQHMPGYETMELCEEAIEEIKPYIEYRILFRTAIGTNIISHTLLLTYM